MNYKILLSSDWWFSPIEFSKYGKIYLFLSAAILIATIAIRIFLFFRGNRPEVYRSFDRLWFWGFLTLGLAGLFIYFSRTQSLPLFGIRATSYFWLLAIFVWAGFLLYYYQKIVPEKLNSYIEKKRKSKYLKK